MNALYNFLWRPVELPAAVLAVVVAALLATAIALALMALAAYRPARVRVPTCTWPAHVVAAMARYRSTQGQSPPVASMSGLAPSASVPDPSVPIPSAPSPSGHIEVFKGDWRDKPWTQRVVTDGGDILPNRCVSRVGAIICAAHFKALVAAAPIVERVDGKLVPVAGLPEPPSQDAMAARRSLGEGGGKA